MTELYLARTEPLKDHERYEMLVSRVHPERRARIERLRLSEDRRRALAAQLLLEHALRRHGIKAPSFSYGEHGKPMLHGADGIHFNLSHSESYAVCVISDVEVGVDIERIDPSVHCLAVAERFFDPAETAWIREGKDDAQRTERFFRLWTLKESFMKATGMGFSISAREFSFSMDGKRPVLSTVPHGFSAHYIFEELPRTDGYRLAICMHDDGNRDAVRLFPTDLKTLC